MNEKTLTERKDMWDILLLPKIYEYILEYNKTVTKGLKIGPKNSADTSTGKLFLGVNRPMNV